MKVIGILKLVAMIIICQLAGIIGSFLTRSSIQNWYYYLTKPSFSPPNWLFAPAWITLYLLMGISAFLIWREGLNTPGVKNALIIFAIQLILNALWSPVFFGLRSPIAGLIIIVILWIAILITLLTFIKISTIAGVLLIPYIVWISFAAVLNYSIYILNPTTS